MFGAAFKGIGAGDRVKFLVYAGMGRNGPEYREATATVNRLLIFEDHVVVNHGTCGQVVNAENYIAHRHARSRKWQG
jgi:hypothetical protein